MNPESLLIRLAKYILIFLLIYVLVLPFFLLIIPFIPDSVFHKNNFLLSFQGFKSLPTQIIGSILSFFEICLFVISFHLKKRKKVFDKIIFTGILEIIWVLLSCIITFTFQIFLKDSKIKSFSDFYSISIIEKISYIFLFLVYTSPFWAALFIVIKKFRNKGDQGKAGKQKKQLKKEDTTYNLVLNTEHQKININNPFRGIYIQGGAGSGKTASIIEPLLTQFSEQGYTGILYDFKSPELSLKSLNLYSNNSGIRSYFVDFKEPTRSNRVNPIKPEYLQKTAFALEYSLALINNMIPESVKQLDFWSRNSWMLLSGVIWYMKKNYPQYCTLPHVISLLLHTDLNRLILKISEDYEAGGLVSSIKQAIDRDAEKQVAGVLSTLQNALSSLNTADIFWILSGDDLSLDLNNPSEPKFLNIGNDSTLSSTYSPVISLIITVALRQMNRENRSKSVIMLDEAPTIYIPNFDQIPATARSNKIATVFSVQDFSQMIDRYGKDKAQAILSNLGNQFFGRTVNLTTAEMITRLFARKDITFETQSFGSGTSGKFVHFSSNSNTTTGESIQERDRIKVSDVTNFDVGEFCGIISEGSPREFISEQLYPSKIDISKVELSSKTSDILMKNNYYKIIEEAKSIF